MFCPDCGTGLPENASFCPECGNRVTVTKEQVFGEPQQTEYTSPFENGATGNFYESQSYSYPGDDYANPDAGKVDFTTAIKLFFKNYANFEGRATKSEFWWVFLFNMLVSTLSNSIKVDVGEVNIVASVVYLALLIPGLAITVRRLHDTGKKWTYMLINLIPLVGWILFIIQLCQDSDGDNQWGPRTR